MADHAVVVVEAQALTISRVHLAAAADVMELTPRKNRISGLM